MRKNNRMVFEMDTKLIKEDEIDYTELIVNQKLV